MDILTLSNGGKSGELLIYEDIGENWWTGGGVSAVLVHKLLKDAGDKLEELTVRINSPGGVVTDGSAIYNALNRHKARVIVEIDGIAASAASVIAMAGDEIRIAKNALIMIHEASGGTWGDAADHEKTAGVLRRMSNAAIDIYAARTTTPRETLVEWVRDETWLSADEAIAAGFATHVIAAKEPPKGAWNPKAVLKYKHVPQSLTARLSALGDESVKYDPRGPRPSLESAPPLERLKPHTPAPVDKNDKKTSRAATSAQTQERRRAPGALAELAASRGRARLGR